MDETKILSASNELNIFILNILNPIFLLKGRPYTALHALLPCRRCLWCLSWLWYSVGIIIIHRVRAIACIRCLSISIQIFGKMAKTTFLMTRILVKNNKHIWCVTIMKLIQLESQKLNCFQTQKKTEQDHFSLLRYSNFSGTNPEKVAQSKTAITFGAIMVRAFWLAVHQNWQIT